MGTSKHLFLVESVETNEEFGRFDAERLSKFLKIPQRNFFPRRLLKPPKSRPMTPELLSESPLADTFFFSEQLKRRSIISPCP